MRATRTSPAALSWVTMDSIPPANTTIEALLRERAWVARLARGLARDPHAADDLEQESWLDTLLRPPRHAANLRSWLAQRVRHTFHSGARGDVRRVHREALAARAEAESETQAAVDRADLARELVEIVLKLEEPYRSALVLVYLEGLTPGEVARRQELPASTVRTHLQRGLERVRAELARRRGDWRSALSALALVRSPASKAAVFLTSGTLAKVVGAAAALVLALIAIRAWQGAPPEPSPLAPGPSVALASAEPEEPTASPARTALVDAPSTLPSEMRPGLRIRAVHDRDNSPLIDAALRVRWFDDAWRVRRWYLRTDEQGRAELAAPPPGRVLVESDHGGWVEGILDPENGLDLELRVDDRLAVRGRVVDPRGSPVAGASVRVGWNTYPEEDVEVAVTGANGGFTFRNEGGGRRVGAWHEDYSASPRPEIGGRDGQRVELVLRLGGPSAAISVRVLDADGNPVSRSWVQVSTPAQELTLPDGSRATGPGGWLVDCDANGVALVRGLPPGALSVLAGADKHASASSEIALEIGATAELELRLPRGVTLRGIVRDANGEPVPGALLRVGELSPSPLHVGEWECWKDAGPDGTFAFESLRPGTRRVLVDGGERGRRVEDLVLADGGETTWNPVLDAGRLLRGRVVDAQGIPLEGWRVDAEIVRQRRMQDEQVQEIYGWPSEWGSAKTNARGEFTLANQLAYELSLTVRGPFPQGRTPRLVRNGVRAGGEPIELVVDTIAERGWLVGRVLDPTGVPVAARVRVVRDEETVSREIQQYDGDPITGRFRAGPLLPGVHLVTVEAEGWPMLKLDPVSVASREKDLGDVKLVKPASLRILVRAPGVPEHELRVSLSGPFEGRDAAVSDGRVSVDGLAPGHWRVQLTRNGVASRSTRSPTKFELEAGGTTEIELSADPP